ncbi:MAG: molecular chaperone DnaJ [Alphaproteobacteria bacterium]|nr:molecular chaperone DnaJ [Alphaproteobacteria bacterium]
MTRIQGNRVARDGRVQDGVERACEHPGCREPAHYRAPRGPEALNAYRWFCLDHVRAFNQGWDYFAGWSQPEIERFQRESVTGHRPTWPLGKRPHDRDPDWRYHAARQAFRNFAREWLDEDVMNDAEQRGSRRTKNGNNGDFDETQKRQGSPWAEALAALGLDGPVSKIELKRRYKELVKRHHPDANGGSRESEERLKLINRAYTYLRQQIVQ